jgi:hypothetical protein
MTASGSRTYATAVLQKPHDDVSISQRSKEEDAGGRVGKRPETPVARCTREPGSSSTSPAQHPTFTADKPASTTKRPPRALSHSHSPRVQDAEGEYVYVVTLLTDKALHDRMTELRNAYFPPHLNKLDAHLTFFHALPGSELERSVIPVIQDVASQTAPFEIRAVKPFRLRRGFAIGISKPGSAKAQEVYHALQRPWIEEGFLSKQDSGNLQLHYTLMNKVDNESEIARTFEDFRDQFMADRGIAVGLGLWRYDRGWWKWQKKFDFVAKET